MSVLPAAQAANLKIVLARLFTLRVRRLNTLPPLILAPGHSPNQEQNAPALRHWLISVPISPMSIRTLIKFNPQTLIKSTPQMRVRATRKSIVAALGPCWVRKGVS